MLCTTLRAEGVRSVSRLSGSGTNTRQPCRVARVRDPEVSE
jgi:hypothetical protein